jgi:hypothetical protein
MFHLQNMVHIDHDWLNIHTGRSFDEGALALTAWGLPPDLARDIVRRAYWLNCDTICKKYCTPSDCCHVLGYEDVFEDNSTLPKHVLNYPP